MKAIVEQYAKGEFATERPEVEISEQSFKINTKHRFIVQGCPKCLIKDLKDL